MGASSCIGDYQDAIREDFKKGNKVQWKTHKCKAYTVMAFVWYTHTKICLLNSLFKIYLCHFQVEDTHTIPRSFGPPNLLNGEQLTCSKAACEGGGTVLRFNCPQKMQSLLNLWHGLYSHSYLGKVSGPPLGIVVCLTSGQNVLTKCIIPDSCCDMYIFSSQLQRESS